MSDSNPKLKPNANVNFGLSSNARLKRLHTYNEVPQDAELFGYNALKCSSSCLILKAWA